MNTDRLKIVYYVGGLISLILACFCLISFILILQTCTLNTITCVSLAFIVFFFVLSIALAISSFVKYGMARGIDYALDMKAKEELSKL